MTDPLPEVPPEPGTLPKWIPVLIGVLLAVIAGLAVYTGIHYGHDGTLLSQVKPRRDRSMTPAPPGEPGAGASLVLHGESGDTTPTANEPVTGQSRVAISGDAKGVQSAERIWARRGMVLNVLPEDAMVYVNDLPIGQVRQFNTMDEVYDFAEPGSYTIRIVAANGSEKTYVVTAAIDAKQEIARISARL